MLHHSIKKSWLKKQDWILVVFVLPVFLYFLIFHYFPLYGIQLAFKDYWAVKGINGSPWIGLDHFRRFFSSYNCLQILENTVVLSLQVLLFGFPMPVILAVLLHHCPLRFLKKGVQNLSYMPHFISTVVMVSMVTIFLSPSGGIFNTLISYLGHEKINFMGEARYFRAIYVISGIWQGMGYGSVIYLAVLCGVPKELYEAAEIDGASNWTKIIHIDFPFLLPTTMLLLIMNCGSLLNIGFEKNYLLQNAMNLSVSEVISTYVYKVGLIDSDYGFSTAVGLFNNIVNAGLLLIVNTIVDKTTHYGLF